MMGIALIADDLTGANDSGVQLAESGLEAVVWVDINDDIGKYDISKRADAFVFNTDSRWLPQEEAYNTVARLSEQLKESSSFVYKKIDSTLRGNIGAELDALYDVWKPDFIAVVPSFPQNGRIVKDGIAYVHGIPLNETEMAQDPTHPIKEKRVDRILQQQTRRTVGTITLDDIRGERLIDRIRQLREIPYLVFDAEEEEDLLRISQSLRSLNGRIIWCGSAGLAQYIQPFDKQTETRKPVHIPELSSVLCVIGSVNIHSRRQLETMLREPTINGIELASEYLLEPETKKQQLERVMQQIAASKHEQSHIVLYTSGDERSIERALEKGRQMNLEKTEVARIIADALGQVAAEAIEQFDFRGFVMTGGDTAKQVFDHLHVAHYQLLGQLEAGIPIGRLEGSVVRYFITKAGGFGSEHALLDAVRYLERGEAT